MKLVELTTSELWKTEFIELQIILPNNTNDNLNLLS